VPHVGLLAVLFGLSLGLTSSVWVSGHPTSSILCSCGDPGQAVWFLEWVPWAITHGHNPFFTQAIFAGQGGANLLQSTSYLLQSFVLAPVTLLFGPTAGFNVGEFLAPVVSGWCMFVAARRVTRSWPGAAGAAVLWGYSPFVLSAEIYGHFNFDVLFFPPLLFVALFDLCGAERRSPKWIGLWLGALVAAQFLAGTELLAVTSLTVIVGIVVALVLCWRQAWARRRRIGTGLAVAAAAAAALVSYPAWVLLDGPRHIVGAPWPGIAIFGSLPGAIVQAGVVHISSPFARIGGYFGPAGPNDAYLGWALLIFIAVSVIVWWRQRIAWVILLTGAGAWLCSFGVVLLPFYSHPHEWWLPWQYLQHLPLIGSIGPNRFSVIVTGAAGLLFAISADKWIALARGLSRRPRDAGEPIEQPAPQTDLEYRERDEPSAEAPAGQRSGGLHRRSRPHASPWWKVATGILELALAGAIALAAIPIARANSWPLTMHTTATPPWFSTTALHLGAHATVLVYPYPSSSVPDAMYWQARDDMRFQLAGGRAEIPGADGRHSQHLKPLGGTDAYLVLTSFGFGIPAAPSARQITELRASLASWRVRVVVVVADGRAPAWAGAIFTEALGRLPVLQHQALTWYSPHADWQSDPPMNVTPAAIIRCSGTGYTEESIEAAPGCVLRASHQ
jgi:hypothetical protein